MLVFLILWVTFMVLTALAANARGRSVVGWTLLAAVFGLFALIAVLVMGPAAPAAATSVPAAPKPVDVAREPWRAPKSKPAPGMVKLEDPDPEEFDQEVVGESHYQDAIRAAIDGAPPARAWARLVPEPNNPHDRFAVRVTMRGETVGYLPRDDARAFSLLDSGTRRIVLNARHPAVVLGGDTLPDGQTARLGVWLAVQGL